VKEAFMRYFVIAIAVVAIFSVIAAVDHYAWSPKDREESQESLEVRNACFKLDIQAKAFAAKNGRYPRSLSEIIEPFKKTMGDSAGFRYGTEIIFHGQFYIELAVDSIKTGTILGYDIRMTNPHLETTIVCTWPPRPVIGG
jgi:hypothetical protein